MEQRLLEGVPGSENMVSATAKAMGPGPACSAGHGERKRGLLDMKKRKKNQRRNGLGKR